MRTIPVFALCLIVVSTTVPFVAKPFHIDDTLYLSEALQILREPLNPYGAQTWWRGQSETLFEANFNPPLFHYLLALVVWGFGESAIALHVLEGTFVAFASVAAYFLSCRFTKHPLVSVSLFVLSPGFLPGQNVMLEGPLLAFLLWAVWCHLRACDRNSFAWSLASGTFVALAVLTKYTGGIVVVPLALWSIFRARPRTLSFVVIPALALIAWSLHNHFYYGRSHLWSLPIASASLGAALRRVPGVVVGFGAMTPVALVVGTALRSRPSELLAVSVATVLQATLFLCWSSSVSLSSKSVEFAVHYFAFALNGVFIAFGLMASLLASRSKIAVSVSEESFREYRRDTVVMVVWVVVILVYNCGAVPFLAIRHLVPALPPVVWLSLRAFECVSMRAVWRRVILGTTVATSALLGFGIAAADFEFARGCRGVAVDAAARIDSMAPAREGRGRWFIGQWGLSYYAQQLGFRHFSPALRAELREGDVLLFWDRSRYGVMDHILREVEYDTLLEESPATRVPIRTIAPAVNYYAYQTDAFGGLPWQFSRAPSDTARLVSIISNFGSTSHEAEQSRDHAD